MRFWDSSAIIPLLVRQPASARVDRWWGDDARAAIWTLTPVEITSALWRLARGEDLSDAQAREAEQRAQELADACYTVADVEGVKALGRRLLRVHAIRAADAMQLGAALIWAGGRPAGKTLHTLDDRLASSARLEGFSVP
ncbi:MAG: type II toxin-antitoxin system VapC family toxin [Gemmatimonadaceae bacterium]